ncbi:hypothetical protein LCGC14_0161610 [marine sediment metagenome]|uniref:Immunity protein 40 domain-containing protein n=1 Tax=marine sediment metagenome TaxID=412755 RepID=A0A0F9XD43_9ZZZZ
MLVVACLVTVSSCRRLTKALPTTRAKQREGRTVELPIEYVRLLETGQSLEERGLSEMGLLKEDALAAVEILKAAGVRILGGDVWTIKDSNYEVTGVWYTDQRPGETDDECTARSWDESSRYIAAYPDPKEEEGVWFVLVPSDGE